MLRVLPSVIARRSAFGRLHSLSSAVSSGPLPRASPFVAGGRLGFHAQSTPQAPLADAHHPGGGKNPLPWSRDQGGGFSGMSSRKFRKYWLTGHNGEFAPLFIMVAVGCVLGIWVAVREFAFNPRYRWSKSRRESFEIDYTEKEVDGFRNIPSIPHPKKGFSLFGVNFTPIPTLEADKRPPDASLHPRLATEATPPHPKGLTSDA